jgi:hypothetical protein
MGAGGVQVGLVLRVVAARIRARPVSGSSQLLTAKERTLGPLQQTLSRTTVAALAMAISCGPAMQAPEPRREPGREGTIRSASCDAEPPSIVCDEIAYLAGITIDFGEGHRVAPARLYVDSTGAVVFESNRRTEAWPKAAKMAFDFIIDPAGRTPPAGIPDWRRLPAKRRGEGYTLRYRGRSDLAAYEITIRLDPVLGGRSTRIESTVRGVPLTD